MRLTIKSLYAALIAAAIVGLAPTAKADVKFIGAGSSAMWQQFALAAVNDPTLAGAGSHHWTSKGKCPDALNCAQAFDNRTGLGGTVSDLQGGNVWVVWNSAQTNIWVYLSVDSTVGNRLFFAQPRATLEIDTNALNAHSGLNLISPALFKYGVHTTDPGCPASGAGSTTCDDTSLPAAVYNAINKHVLTAGMTDIRPEDALFASTRVLCVPNNGTTCLGYGPGPVGTSIKSDFSSSVATPVKFRISGTDPVSGQPIPAFNTYPVGAQPIILIINKLPGGLGGVHNVTHAQLQSLFSGVQCNILGVTTTALLREPLSGTMNTFEYTNMTNPTFSTGHSQETGVSTNPLNQPCPGGTRERGIGTGDIVTGLIALTTQAGPKNAIGYVFFSYGNVSKLAGSATYGYLTLDGFDPLVGNPGYVAGTLPVCSLPCPAHPNSTFTNLRNGSYRSWSMLRLVTDTQGLNNTYAKALVSAAQNDINLFVPDFVPYVAANGDSGMQFYRSHFAQSPNNPINGIPFAEPSTEKGGDVGGCIEPKTRNVLGAHENETGGCAK